MKVYRYLHVAAVSALMLAVGGGIAAAHPGGDDDGHAHESTATAADDQPEPLEPLARDCSQSDLPPHDGFQDAPACVDTAFGEVTDAALGPQLLFAYAPDEVTEGEDFALGVSSRNLVRDRFLPAADGGYYLESSVLNEDGLQRGHFHVGCRVLESARVAPDPEPAPAFFQGVEDGGGGAKPDEVWIEVPGEVDGEPRFDSGDLVQCAAWAGDGSHRVPMMERANQVPAFDVVRIQVK